MNLIKTVINISEKIIGKDNFFRLKLIKLKYIHQKELKRIRKKEKINVVFFLIHHAVWKYEKLYHLFENDPRFAPSILVCPYMMYSSDVMHKDMNNAYEIFKKEGYNVKKALKEDNTWVDVKEELQSDIIFFGNPHFITKPHYYIYYLKNILSCYVPYNFGNSHMLNMFHNQDFHNLLWKLFAETEIHKQYSVKTARNKGDNVVVTGFPGTDVFLETQNKSFENLWKHPHTKKILWSPHHTIDDNKDFISFSSFNTYHEEIFSLLEKYKGKLEIIFKPHPLLKLKLYDDPDWGKEKTDTYFSRWETHPYGGLSLGRYEDLFLSSDAMIHDSGSFLIEYLYTEKPVLRTDRDDSICDRLNSFGKMAYNVHYIAKNLNDIEQFIGMIINSSEDTLKEKRKEFKQQFLLPPNGKTASENIYNFIKSQLE
ncbi:CDP-glycerol glycerophosphotransferase family protein [Riemerella anatipestifer]|uniref:CDP-glycerol glycerophosphotransferase family protein n=1 Tax=Bergeyella anatis TaxID=3113737 RepID=UPI002E17783F|nr:CDP-glycerol glycerophosphotransferase family protein [Bergeyella sp. RCAD1439]